MHQDWRHSTRRKRRRPPLPWTDTGTTRSSSNPRSCPSCSRTFPTTRGERLFRKRQSSLYNICLAFATTCRVIYAIYEYDPLLDSSNMTMDDWIVIAKDIKRSYEHFDGFVILHGTDTLAYTASALSFMLEHLGKPVIVTGSQG